MRDLSTMYFATPRMWLYDSWSSHSSVVCDARPGMQIDHQFLLSGGA
jgi:hypothetical protein